MDLVLPLNNTVIQGILLGVVGNGLWSLVALTGTKAFRGARDLISPPRPSVVEAIRLASDQLLASTVGTGFRQERLVAYLSSPEVELIVRQLFATSLVGSADDATMTSVKRELISSMSRSLDVDEQRIEPFAMRFLDGLVAIVEEALRKAMEGNILSAHEALAAARDRRLLDEISNLRENLSLLTSKPSLDVAEILAFEGKYREAVESVHAHIRPPHLDNGRRIPIEKIFVAPGISWIPRQRNLQSETLDFQVFLSGLYRGVLLGNPGGGKSTFLSKICHDLAAGYSDRLLAGREVTPALVVLREYGNKKKATSCSIVEFLGLQAASRYQIIAPEKAFEYLLLNGRLVVLFDGLDELLESGYRQEITSNVETFCKLYPSVPVLVTSREVGYEQAPLDEEKFETFRLAPFDDHQVKEYAQKWFELEEDYSLEKRIKKARAFFSDSAIVPDLRSNPLMLALMCNLYRSEGYIPRNRPEVYEKCSVMLFERWDKGREITVPLSFEEHIRPAMQDLAFWIFSNEELQSGVTEHALTERTTEYLRQWIFDDPQKAKTSASDFVRFCTGRAWVFTDLGTTPEGEGVYQFTHGTFLEYFTACYLVSTHQTPKSLSDQLAPRIGKGEWDVVAQLAFQIQSKQFRGGADELLTSLIATQTTDWNTRWRTLSFATRSLEFLVPRPPIRREVTRGALDLWLSLAKQGISTIAAHEHIGYLMAAAVDNRDTVADEIRSFLKEAVNSPDGRVAGLAAESMLDLMHISSVKISGDALAYWETVSEGMVIDCRDRIWTSRASSGRSR